MKLSGIQAQLLFMTLRESCGIYGDRFSLDPDARLRLVNEILSQQGKEIIDYNEEAGE